jgi:hypothetical protein
MSHFNPRRPGFFILILTTVFSTVGLAAETGTNPYAAIYDNILQANADSTVDACARLQETLASDSGQKRHDAFVNLAQAWARVQASYILGGYDMGAMDYPLLIAYFHVGKEHIHESLANIIDSDTAAASALYKNSYKNLRALDDVMFSGAWSERRKELATVIAASVCKNLGRVSDGYRKYRPEYLADPKKALSLLVNAEIENIYKTRDWRIAQISGLNKQTLGKPLPQNQQYPYSEASWAVIGAIIATHEQLLAEDMQPNIATIAHEKQADSGLSPVQDALRATRQAYRDTPSDQAFDMQAMIPVFQGLLDMQKAYYRQLVGSIGVTASIIDADGD